MFRDWSRLHNTTIKPVEFRNDGTFRQVVLQPATIYDIDTGGARKDLFQFTLYWIKARDALQLAEQGYRLAAERDQDPHRALTIEEAPTGLTSWYNTRLHTPVNGGVQRVIEGLTLGEGAFGKVSRAVDIDSGCCVAVKKVEIRPGAQGTIDENLVSREVKMLSSVSHVRLSHLGLMLLDAYTGCRKTLWSIWV